MANSYFQFKKFRINQEKAAMKVTTDSCLFGAWIAADIAINSGDVLDIGAGTGLLTLMVAQQRHNLVYTAVEIEENAFLQAKENIRTAFPEKNIELIKGDISTLSLPKRYDIIISNPPFYESDLLSPGERKNQAHHNTGLTLKALVEVITIRLNENGCFYLLLPLKRLVDIQQLLEEYGLSTWVVYRVRHSSQHTPIRVMIKGGFKPTVHLVQKEIIIRKDDNSNYTKEFRALLADYYLAF